mmetsp:Transcript_12882/g.36220  ORF Transcript_12882/g.36220 Transcript_12882/m.36220 type:complete len:229 (+) Transcript_12882:255-941(+)|eukprot:CAMPEP_0117697878 /NCGR_PEP_ID=MMETSP0804-20121206/29472_1 /TAXON_ID=1074897 /ORGANISM="Tetraselmis astigmatica, Strain CCMP880" /LENGTH=228 /DNA_ID=CAMNT_0005512175 /DNA_START=167 /DNA_END=853 /DNA_ORIENTATION=+
MSSFAGVSKSCPTRLQGVLRATAQQHQACGPTGLRSYWPQPKSLRTPTGSNSKPNRGSCLLFASLGSEEQTSAHNGTPASTESETALEEKGSAPNTSDASPKLPAAKDSELCFGINETEITQPGCSTAFKLNIIWQEDFCAIAVDQLVVMRKKTKAKVYRSPVTEYFFWPEVDAWEELKAVLENKSWISERDTILILNSLTDIINFWQEMHTKSEAIEQFSEVATFEA